MAGPDRGKGGTYVILPPGYEGEVPAGYHVARSATYSNWLLIRGFLEDGNPKPGVKNIKDNFKLYPLGKTASDSKVKYHDISMKYLNTIHASDETYFEEINKVVQEEPSESQSPEILGLLASIGIEKGKPFDPDARMQHIFAQAAKLGVAMARTNAFDSRDPDVKVYPDRQWETVFIGGSSEFEKNGYRNLDARSLFHYEAIVITPAMAAPMPEGIGSKYLFGYKDADGNYLDGSKTYRLHIPADVPVKDFWSVTIYDPATRSQLQTSQPFPSIGSQGLPGANSDGSVDIYFGPKPPKGKEKFWLETVPGKGWFPVIRFYGPLKAYSDKTWKPDDIVLVK